MASVSLAFRILLAGVFLTAAIGKLSDLSGSRAAVREFGVPRRLADGLGTALPGVELITCVALLLQPTAIVGAALSLALLVGFTAGIAGAILRGEAPDCHCFGQIHSEPAGPSSLVRNGMLAALAVVNLVDGPGQSIAGFGHDGGDEVGLGVAVLLACAFALATVQLAGERGRLRAELERAPAARPPAGLPTGVPAPAFDLTPTRGASGALADIRRPGLPTVLVFVSTTCPPCLQLFPILARWQDLVSHSLTIAAVFAGPHGDIERLAEEHELTLALAQERREVFAAYSLRATPSGVLVDADGRIAAAPAEGTAAIEALIRSALAAKDPAGEAVSGSGLR
jgi:thiol-disulfide isomerase/thioredoxin